MTNMPPPETHDETGRRDDETRRGRGDKSSDHNIPRNETKRTREKHIGDKADATRRPPEMRNETQDETSTDGKQIGGTK